VLIDAGELELPQVLGRMGVHTGVLVLEGSAVYAIRLDSFGQIDERWALRDGIVRRELDARALVNLDDCPGRVPI
jgi:hypothetical protein